MHTILTSPLALILALFLLLASPIRCDSESLSEQPKQKMLTIGIVLPLSGPLAWVGTAMRKGIELAAAQPIAQSAKLIFQDDLSSNRSSAVSAFRALTSINKVDAILNCSTSTLTAVAPIINQTKTATIVIWDSNREMPKLSPFLIGFGYANEKAAEEAADFLTEQKKRQRIAVISYHNDWSALLTEAFTAQIAARGAMIVVNEAVEGSTTDYRTMILRAKQNQADALYLPLFGIGLVSAIRQARELKFAGTILTVDSLGEAEMRDVGSAAEGIYASQLFLPYNDLASNSGLRALAATTSAVDIGYTALGYDSLMMVITAAQRTLREATSLNSLIQVNEIKASSYKGELGSVTINEQGIADRTIPILEVVSGQFKNNNLSAH